MFYFVITLKILKKVILEAIYLLLTDSKYNINIIVEWLGTMLDQLCCEINLDRNHTNEKQRCVEQKIVVILGLSVFKQQHTQELKQWHKTLAKHKDKQA